MKRVIPILLLLCGILTFFLANGYATSDPDGHIHLMTNLQSVLYAKNMCMVYPNITVQIGNDSCCVTDSILYFRLQSDDVVTLTANAGGGFPFVRWSDGVTSRTRLLTYETLTNNYSIYDFVKTLTAEFEPSSNPHQTGVPCTLNLYTTYPYIISPSSPPYDNITVQVTDEKGSVSTYNGVFPYQQTYNYGSIVTITGLYTPGYRTDCEFVRWSDGCTSPTRTILMTNDIDLSFIVALKEQQAQTKQVSLDTFSYRGLQLSDNDCDHAPYPYNCHSIPYVLFEENGSSHMLPTDDYRNPTVYVDTSTVLTVNTRAGMVTDCCFGRGLCSTGNLNGYSIVEAIRDVATSQVYRDGDSFVCTHNMSFIVYVGYHVSDDAKAVCPELQDTIPYIPPPLLNTTLTVLYDSAGVTRSYTHTYLNGIDGISMLSIVPASKKDSYICAIGGWIDRDGQSHLNSENYMFTRDTDTVRVFYNCTNQATLTCITSPPNGGECLGSGIYDIGVSVEISAIPASGYRFVEWNDHVTTPRRTITLTRDTIFTARFEERPPTCMLTLLATPIDGGILTGAGIYDAGALVPFSVTPNEGYDFIQWSDSVTVPERSITLTEDVTLTAQFARIQCVLNLSAQPSEAGTTIGSGTYDYGTKVTLVAKQIPGWRFYKWSDGSGANRRRLVLTERQTTIEAIYIREEELHRGWWTAGLKFIYPQTNSISVSPQDDTVRIDLHRLDK